MINTLAVRVQGSGKPVTGLEGSNCAEGNFGQDADEQEKDAGKER